MILATVATLSHCTIIICCIEHRILLFDSGQQRAMKYKKKEAKCEFSDRKTCLYIMYALCAQPTNVIRPLPSAASQFLGYLLASCNILCKLRIRGR